jgi:hypothetical protein
MKITEEVLERASILAKEYRRVSFRQITRNDFVQLTYSLWELFWPPRRRKCKLWVYVGPVDCYFDNEKELHQFMKGFTIAMELNDPSFRDNFDQYQRSQDRNDL